MRLFNLLLVLAIFCLGLSQPTAAEDKTAQSTKDRVVVRGADYPWRAIGRLQWAGVGNRAHCTGALIGKKLVITAAHCLYNLYTEQWIKASQVHFLAGFDRGEFVDHSVAEKTMISPNFDPVKWNEDSNLPYDWALVYLEKPIGDEVGYLGWQPFSNKKSKITAANKSSLVLAGYPRDRQYVLSLESSCIIDSFDISGNLFKHNCKLAHGDSGGPFTIMKNGRLSVIGLNSAVIGENGHTQSTAIALGPIAKFITQLLREDGTLPSNQSSLPKYGWVPTENLGS